MVFVGDHVFGLGCRSLKCIELKMGEVVWENFSVGKGFIIYVDGYLVVCSEKWTGELVLVVVMFEGY